MKAAVDHDAANDVRAHAEAKLASRRTLQSDAGHVVESFYGHLARSIAVSARPTLCHGYTRGISSQCRPRPAPLAGRSSFVLAKVALSMIEELKQKLGEEAEKQKYELNVKHPQDMRKPREPRDQRDT